MKDLRGETLYFVQLDRFANGDPTNDAGRDAATFDPTHRDFLRHWGGDLKGVLERLPYLQRLGITVLVLSPVVEQLPSIGRDRGMLASAWHGGWAYDMRRLDPHLVGRGEWDRPFGRWDTVFDELLAACHAVGMRVVVQVYCGQSNPGGAHHARGEMLDDGKWLLSFEHDGLGWYRREGGREGQDGPPMFDAGSATFRAWMRDVLAGWLRRGVDGFLFEEADQMPLWFWQELSAHLSDKAGAACLLGKWSGRGWDDLSIAFADRSGVACGDFGFHRGVQESLCWQDVGGLRRIATYLEHDHALADATSLITSLECGWTTRLQSAGLRREHLAIALVLLLTSRGVPMLTYGVEQGLHLPGGEHEPHHAPMMEGWDDTAESDVIWRLAMLRRGNLAVQRGRYRTLWVNEDVLVYARSHVEDHVVVALNRGRAVTIDVAEVPFGDGPVVDVLSGAGAMVRGQRIAQLHLPSGAARVFAVTRARERVGASATCALSGYRSRFGESVVVIGDAPELGGWDTSRAVRMHYANPNLWLGTVGFEGSAGRVVLYKYAVIDQRGTVLREDRLPRRREAPTRAGEDWSDRWGER